MTVLSYDVTRYHVLAKRLNLTLHEVANGDMFVKSCKGNWYLELTDKNVKLWHLNFDGITDGHRSFSKSYHFQKYMPCIEDTLRYIHAHDAVRYTQYERTERIFGRNA